MYSSKRNSLASLAGTVVVLVVLGLIFSAFLTVNFTLKRSILDDTVGITLTPAKPRLLEDAKSIRIKNAVPLKHPSEILNNLESASSTVLIFDVSDSMNDTTPGGTSKIEVARKAGVSIVDVIGVENTAAIGNAARQSQVGLVTYNNSVSVPFGLSTDLPSARIALVNLNATGRTAMADALRAGIDQFSLVGSGKRIIILLSDGLPNIGLGGDANLDESTVRQQVFELASEAGSKSICVYTVGFGDPNTGTIDESLLREIASRSGCGMYYNATDAIQLANVYVELRHESLGEVLLNKDGQISQGSQIDLGSVSVKDNQDMMLFTLNWPGSRLEATLIDPNGISVNQNYPGATYSVSASLVSVVINNPKPGNWKIGIYGADISEGSTVYKALLSTRAGSLPTVPPSTPMPVPAPVSGFSLAALLLVLAIGFIAVFVYARNLKRGAAYTKAVTPAWLVGASGGYVGQRIPLRDGFTLGRSHINSLQLPDPFVSRRHAIFRFANGNWFIQKVNNHSVILINGVLLVATRLNSGDRIRLGSQDFIFYVG
jgi:uncharacterized protein YegL